MKIHSLDNFKVVDRIGGLSIVKVKRREIYHVITESMEILADPVNNKYGQKIFLSSLTEARTVANYYLNQ